MKGFLRGIGWLANAIILFFLITILIRLILESGKKKVNEVLGGPLLIEITDFFLNKFTKGLLPVLEGKSLQIASLILLALFYILIKIFLL